MPVYYLLFKIPIFFSIFRQNSLIIKRLIRLRHKWSQISLELISWRLLLLLKGLAFSWLAKVDGERDAAPYMKQAGSVAVHYA